MKKVQPLILIVMDGWGLRKSKAGNAIALAKTPNLHRFSQNYPKCVLTAHDGAVGLPPGVIGNSEVGHMHIGSGRLIRQDLTMINEEIKSGRFFRNKVLIEAIDSAKKKGSTLHIMGLLSDGGVHSHINHLFALLELARRRNLHKVMVHCFLDGRDTPQKSAKKYVKELQKKIKKLKEGKIATVMGRYYAMDRDNRWNREHKAYDAMVNGFGLRYEDPIKAIDDAYKKGQTDEFIEPIIICKRNEKGCHVKEHDSIIFFNFREDRAREITRAFAQGTFNEFKREKIIDLDFVGLVQYDKKIRTKVVYPPEEHRDILAEVLSGNNINQLRVAETEKYAHVTYFFNAGRDRPFSKEGRLLIPSPKVPTYDIMPEMSAYKITEKLISEIKKKRHEFILVNFANADMVGHTGMLDQTVKAVEVVDECVGKVVAEAREQGYIAIITADHGNAEEMTGKHKTTHTTNKVPFIIVSDKNYRLKDGNLYNIAPTVLELMGIEKPKIMDKGLIRR